MIKSIVLVNNYISDQLAYKSLQQNNIKDNEFILIKLRKFKSILESVNNKHNIYEVPISVKSTINLNNIFNLISLVKIFKKNIHNPKLESVYVCNNAHLFCNAAFQYKKIIKSKFKIKVLVEGTVNFEPGTGRSINLNKKIFYKLLSLFFNIPWRHLNDHITGSMNELTDEVISFSRTGLNAIESKIKIYKFDILKPKIEAKKNNLLIIHSPLNAIVGFSDKNYKKLCDSLKSWLLKQQHDKIYIKYHPNFKDIYLTEALSNFELFEWDGHLENNADILPAKQIISFHSAALLTLKMKRPDLSIYAFGVDYYNKITNQELTTGINKLYNSMGISIIDTEKLLIK